MRTTSRGIGLAAALTAIAALGGCGSSGPSKADFVKKADENFVVVMLFDDHRLSDVMLK